MPRSSDQESEYGWVFDNPDVGEQFSVDHPITSGECDDATNIRPATFTERWLWDGMQSEFQKFLAQENKSATLRAERDAALVAVEGMRKALEQAERCISDIGSGKGGWAWEEVVTDIREALSSLPNAQVKR